MLLTAPAGHSVLEVVKESPGVGAGGKVVVAEACIEGGCMGTKVCQILSI